MAALTGRRLSSVPESAIAINREPMMSVQIAKVIECRSGDSRQFGVNLDKRWTNSGRVVGTARQALECSSDPGCRTAPSVTTD
jgi:hypothetical protein